jgi:hypothetical protein
VSYDFACDIYEHLCLLKVRVQRFYKEKRSFECKKVVLYFSTNRPVVFFTSGYAKGGICQGRDKKKK